MHDWLEEWVGELALAHLMRSDLIAWAPTI
jgi:hypothetical protein